MDIQNISNIIRQTRQEQGLTQEQLAALSGVGRRFVVELEAGKPTCHFGKALDVINTLGIDIILTPRR